MPAVQHGDSNGQEYSRITVLRRILLMTSRARGRKSAATFGAPDDGGPAHKRAIRRWLYPWAVRDRHES